MASSTTIASVIQSLQASTGAIKAQATQIVSAGSGIAGSGQTFQLTGDALSNLQNQLHSVRQNALGLAQYIQNIPTTISVGSDTQIIFNEKNVLVGSDNLTFNYTTGYMTVLSVDGTYSVGIGQPATGIAIQISNLTSSDVIDMTGNSITALKAGVAGKTVWSLGDAAGDGTLSLANGSGTSGFDGHGALVYGKGSSGEMQMELLGVGAPGSGGWDSAGATVYATGSSGLLQAYVTQIGSFSIYVETNQNSLVGVDSGSDVFYLKTAGSAGLIGICNGSGSGGFDSAGATIYGQGSTGQFYCIEANILTPSSAIKCEIASASISFINSSGFQTIFLGDSGGYGLLEMFNATDNLVFVMNTNTNGWTLLDTFGNSLNGGGKTVNSLAGNIAGRTIFSLADDGSNNGILALSNGSGTGGFDGAGAQIYAQASTGLIQAIDLQLTTNLQVGTGSSTSTLNDGSLTITASSYQIAYIGTAAGTGSLVLKTSSGGPFCQISPGLFGGIIFELVGLPSTSPGAGSDQFWYDPTDSNRVKYAA